ncbi:MAG: hypothetical protein PVJ38_02515 [Candidatus Bathyarchaeota archaeon]|jgi:hypothetical protein
MTDPKLSLKEILEGHWALGFEPKFSTDWYQAGEQLPQVVVSHILTQPRYLGFTDNHPRAQRRFEAVYAVDVWSKGDQEARWRMVWEVDRILHSVCDEPGGGLEWLESMAWRDLDEGGMHPRLYRSRVRVSVLYYR